MHCCVLDSCQVWAAAHMQRDIMSRTCCLQLKLLASEENGTSLPAWRAQDNVMAVLIVVSAALAITWGTAEVSSQLFGFSALSELLQTAVRHATELSVVLPKLWAALLAGITEGRRAFSAQPQAA